MSQSEEFAKARAAEALCHVTQSNGDYLMHVGDYSPSPCGGSIRASLASQFIDYHDLDTGETVKQFFDSKTGALVIIPEQSTDSVPSMRGSDD
jgi:hypothetical protein